MWAGPRPASSIMIIQKEPALEVVDSVTPARIMSAGGHEDSGCQKQMVSDVLWLCTLLGALFIVFTRIGRLGWDIL